MHLLQDEPGRALHLQGEPPWNFKLLSLLLFISPFFLWGPLVLLLMIYSPGRAKTPLMGILLGILSMAGAYWGLVSLVRYLLRSSRVLVALTVDSLLGYLEYKESSTAGLPTRSTRIDLREVLGFDVETIVRADGSIPRFLVRIHRDDQRAPVPLGLSVDGVTTREAVFDFTHRLGAAAGLTSLKVVRNDPREIELLLRNEANVPSAVVRPVARAAYAHQVSPPEVHASDAVIPSFVAEDFPSDDDVTVWEPGKVVRIERAFNPGNFFVLLIPAVLCLGMVVVFWYFGAVGGIVGVLRRVTGIVMLGPATVGWISVALYRSLPQRCVFDWQGQTISLASRRSARIIPFRQIRSLEVRGIRHYHRNGHHSYAVEVVLLGEAAQGGPKWTLMAVDTWEHVDDPQTPYEAALPLGVELAKALGVPWRYVGYR